MGQPYGDPDAGLDTHITGIGFASSEYRGAGRAYCIDVDVQNAREYEREPQECRNEGEMTK